jgi:hypothetical protein
MRISFEKKLPLWAEKILQKSGIADDILGQIV